MWCMLWGRRRVKKAPCVFLPAPLSSSFQRATGSTIETATKQQPSECKSPAGSNAKQAKKHLCRDGTLRPWLFLIHHRLNFLFRPPTCTSFLPRQSLSASWHLYTPELFLSKTSPIFTWQLKIVQAENPWRKIYQLVKTWANVGNSRIPPHSSILLVKV